MWHAAVLRQVPHDSWWTLAGCSGGMEARGKLCVLPAPQVCAPKLANPGGPPGGEKCCRCFFGGRGAERWRPAQPKTVADGQAGSLVTQGPPETGSTAPLWPFLCHLCKSSAPSTSLAMAKHATSSDPAPSPGQESRVSATTQPPAGKEFGSLQACG